MEIKKVLSELEKVNDINVLSVEELKKKYLKNEEIYNDFIKTYGEFFTSHFMYQLRASNKYEKIVNLLYDGNTLFISDDNVAYLEDILNKMKNTTDNYGVSITKPDDRYESMYLFNSSIMPISTVSERIYEQTVTSIFSGGKKYAECCDDSINDFLIHLFYKQKLPSEERINFIYDYKNDHKMMDLLCNSKDFLVFSNYMVTNDKKNVDEKFISDVKSVIKISKLLQELGFVDENFNKEEYNKLASFTLKNINKEKRKIEQKEDQAIRKTIKLFNKSSNK